VSIFFVRSILIEEVGRHYGFDRLEAAFPVMTQAAAPPDPRVARDHLVRRVCAAAGLNEAVTFGFIERHAAEAFVTARAHRTSSRWPIPFRPSSTCCGRHFCPSWVGFGCTQPAARATRTSVCFEIGVAYFTTASGESRGPWRSRATGSLYSEHWSGTARDSQFDFFARQGRLVVLL
jgi:phenylalanyl-tRNA synthetase beta subunit